MADTPYCGTTVGVMERRNRGEYVVFAATLSLELMRVPSVISEKIDRGNPHDSLICWCRVRDLNSRPTVYKTAALPLS